MDGEEMTEKKEKPSARSTTLTINNILQVRQESTAVHLEDPASDRWLQRASRARISSDSWTGGQPGYISRGGSRQVSTSTTSYGKNLPHTDQRRRGALPTDSQGPTRRFTPVPIQSSADLMPGHAETTESTAMNIT